MELEEKVNKLKEEIQGLPKLLIKVTLCNDDVNEDLQAAYRCLPKFDQTKNPFVVNPVTAPVNGLNSLKENNWSEEGKVKQEKRYIICTFVGYI